MDPSDIFLVRFHQWATVEAISEVSTGMPILRSLSSPIARRFVRFADTLSASSQILLMQGLAKRWRERATLLLGVPITEEEQDLTLRFLASSTAAPDEQYTKQGVRTLARRSHLRQLVRAAVVPVIGEKMGSHGGNLTSFRRRQGELWIDTLIDMGGRNAALGYEHFVHHESGLVIVQRVSVLSWLGISGMTCWDVVDDQDAEAVSSLLARLCSHFVSAIPGLVRDIEWR